MRVQFETGLDDLVDLNVRVVSDTKFGGRQRTRSIWGAAVAFTLSVFVVSAAVAQVTSFTGLLLLAGLAGALGVVFGLLYRSVYDSALRRRLRDYLREQLGDKLTWVCEIELRPEGAWSRDHGVELMFPWSEATAVEDVADGIQLRFRSGVILARNRAFAAQEERKRFIEVARASAQT